MRIYPGWLAVRPFKTPESRTSSEKTTDRGCNERETLSFSASRVSAHVGRQSHHLKPPGKMLPASHDNKNNHCESEQRSYNLATLCAFVIFLKNNPALSHNIFDVYQRWKSKIGASAEIPTFSRVLLRSLQNMKQEIISSNILMYYWNRESLLELIFLVDNFQCWMISAAEV